MSSVSVPPSITDNLTDVRLITCSLISIMSSIFLKNNPEQQEASKVIESFNGNLSKCDSLSASKFILCEKYIQHAKPV